VRLYGFRHRAATIALAAGVDMKVVQEMLRHSSISVTNDLCTSVLLACHSVDRPMAP
jgi:site-specific recombinase XerD